MNGSSILKVHVALALLVGMMIPAQRGYADDKCPGTKIRYKGKCHYPPDVRQMKRAARLKARPPGKRSPARKVTPPKSIGRSLALKEKQRLWFLSTKRLKKSSPGNTSLWALAWDMGVETVNDFLPFVGTPRVKGLGYYGYQSNNVHDLLGKLIGVKVILRTERRFGAPITYFNPRIADWLVTNLLPGRGQSASGSPFVTAFYEKSLRPFVRLMAAALFFQLREGTPGWFKANGYLRTKHDKGARHSVECRKFIGEVKAGKWLVLDAGMRSAHQAEYAYHAWLRRLIDGSHAAFGRALVVVLKRYDRGYYKRHRKLLAKIK